MYDLKMSPNTVSKIKSGDCNPGHSGRPSVLNAEHVRFIEANSLADARLTDEEIDELLQEEIEYINLLKNNSDAFRLHLSQSSDISLSNDFIMNMLNVNPDFENTVLNNILLYKKTN